MITGEKVILRAIEPSDIRQLWEWTQDEETMRYRDYPAPPSSLAQAEQEYNEYAQSACQCSRHLRLAITTHEGQLIGETSLREIDYRNGGADFVIAIGDKSYWGRGFGTDATRALMRYAFEQLNLRRVTLYVHASNERAIRAYEKCGFKDEGRLREAHYMDGRYTDVLVMGLLRADFEAQERRHSEKAAIPIPSHA